MNLNIINLKPTEWSKKDWNDAYQQYCKANMFGAKTKREYYDMVLANYKILDEKSKPLSDELIQKWTEGKRAAKLWAKQHKCNMDGKPLDKIRAEKDNRSAVDVANRAEDIAVDTMQRLDYLIEVAKNRRTRNVD